EGLGRSGDQAFAILRDLGLADQRLMRAFLSVAGAGDLLRRSVEMGNAAWEQNAALIEEAEKRYRTRASRLRMLQNRLRNALIRFGEGLTPFLESLMGFVDRLVTGLGRVADAFERLPVPVRMVLANLALIVALIGPITWGFGAMNRALAGAIGVWGQFAEMIGKVVTQMRTAQVGLGRAIVQVFGPTRLIIAAIAGLVIAGVWLIANWDRVRSSAIRIWHGIAAVVQFAASIVIRGISAMVNVIAFIIPPLRGAAQVVMGWANSLQEAAKRSWDLARASQPAAQVAEAAKSIVQVAQGARDAADAQEDLADEMTKAGKSAARNLQAFDEVHTLQQDMGKAAPELGLPLLDFPELQMPSTADITGLGDAFGKMAETLAKAGENARGLWSNFLDRYPLVQAAAENITKAALWIRNNWDAIGPAIGAVAGIALILLAPWYAIALLVAGVALYVAANWDKILPVLQRLWDNITGVALPVWEQLKTTVLAVAGQIWQTVQVVWGWITTFWQNWGATILAVLEGVWRQIGIVIETAIRIIGNVIG